MLSNKLTISVDINILMISILITSICYFIDRMYIDNEMNSVANINYSNIEKTANTGDIICFRWNCVDVGFRLFSKYSHVGLIVKKNNKLYILETHPKEDPESNINNSGVHLYKLKKRLDYYDGDLYYSKLSAAINDTQRSKLTNHVINNLNHYKKSIPFDDNFRNIFVLNWFCNIFDLKLPKRKTMFCSEFIASILSHTGIYTHSRNLATLNPGTFLDLKTPQNTNLYNTHFHINLSN
jgi:hypothetical protein